MTSSDIDRVEQALAITLPSNYRRVLESFPVPAYAGNADTDIWDDADRLIEYNRKLRSGAAGVHPWPHEFFAIGRDGGSSQAIDLRTGELWWADGAQLQLSSSYKHRESFEEWAATYFQSLRQELAGEGGDPSGSPSQRATVRAQNERASARLGGYTLLAFAIALAMLVLRADLRR